MSKVSFVIELENGQYLRAVGQVNNATKSIENKAAKSYANMSNSATKHANAVSEVGKRINRAFGIVALIGVAVMAIRSFFGEIIKGSKTLSLFKNSIGAGFKIGMNQEVGKLDKMLGNSKKTAETIAFVTYKITSFLVKIVGAIILIPNIFNSILKTIQIAFNNIKMGILAVDYLLSGKRKTKNLEEGESLFNQNKKLQEDLTKSNLELKKNGSILVASDMNNVEFAKKYNEELEKAKNNTDKLKKATDDYNTTVSALASKLSDMFGEDNEATKLAQNFKGIAIEAEKIGSAIEIANKEGKNLELSTGTILDLFVEAYNIVSKIFVSLADMTSKQSDYEEVLKRINKAEEDHKMIIDRISIQMDVINAKLDEYDLTKKRSIELIDEEIKKENELLELIKDQKAENEKYYNDAKGKNIDEYNRTKQFNEYLMNEAKKKVDFYKNNPIGMAVNFLGFGGPLKGAEDEVKFYENEISKINGIINDINDKLKLEGEIAKQNTEIIAQQLKIEELIKEKKQIMNLQDLEMTDNMERLLQAKLDGAKTDQESANYIDQIISVIEKQIEDYNQLLTTTEDINELLSYQTDIQDHMNQIEGLRAKKEEMITKQIKNQVDLMKQYVDLGLDLENIRTVKQITKSFVSQGYSGVGLGSALQDVGIKSSAIGDKVLNIYGDINNTLNQGTGNMLISQMNNLINNIGGV